MKLQVGNKSFAFTYDDEREQTGCIGILETWAGFHSENSREELKGKNVLFVLESENYEKHPNLADPERYTKALEWLFANEHAVKDTALQGILDYIGTLRDEDDIYEDELGDVMSFDDLTSLIDLSYVRICPHSKDGMPYIGLEFECNWDPSHGCGVLLHGNSLVDVGSSDTAQSCDGPR